MWAARSDRRARLPRDWPQLVGMVKRRASGTCQATVHVPECNGVGTDVDHITPGDNHSPDNLQLLSRPCHKAKTTADRNRWRRQPETHPGKL